MLLKERIKKLYLVARENGRIENGQIVTELTRKDLAAKLELPVSTITYILKWIDQNGLPKIVCKVGARGKKKVDRQEIIDELKSQLGIG